VYGKISVVATLIVLGRVSGATFDKIGFATGGVLTDPKNERTVVKNFLDVFFVMFPLKERLATKFLVRC